MKQISNASPTSLDVARGTEVAKAMSAGPSALGDRTDGKGGKPTVRSRHCRRSHWR